MSYLSWFKFTPSDWVMGKIQRTSEITQARFMRLICLYWNKHCILSYEDAEIEIDKEHLDVLISKKIIKTENDFIIIEFLNDQLVTIAETSEKRKLAVSKRWEKSKQKDTIVIQDDTSVLKNHTIVSENDTSVLQSYTDKIRKDKIRKDNIIEEDFDFSTLKNTEWANQFCKAKNIIPNKFNLIFDSFLSDVILKGQHLEYEDKEKEFKKHFVNWYNKQPTQINQPTVKRNNVVGFNKE